MMFWENDYGDFGICFSLTGVSVINSVDTSRRLEASMSSKLLLVGEKKTGINLYLSICIICMYVFREQRKSKERENTDVQSFSRL